MIGEIIKTNTIIQGNKSIRKIFHLVQNNQSKIHVNKDTGVIYQISIVVSNTFNEMVKPFSINL